MTSSASYIIYAVLQSLMYLGIAAGFILSAIALWKIAQAHRSLSQTAELIAEKLNVELPAEKGQEDKEEKTAPAD